MEYTIRRALPEDVRPALDLALRVFTEFEMPDYPSEALDNFSRHEIENDMFINAYENGQHVLFVALDANKIVGMIAEREGHIALLFVEGSHHRRGIATALMNSMVEVLKTRGQRDIPLDASPYGLPFYEKYGFKHVGDTRVEYGCTVIPMVYILGLNLTVT
jgi:GNAT superfamily N-acetyltransferase